MASNRGCLPIVSEPGFLREGLYAVVGAIPQLKVVGQVDDVTSAVDAVSEHHPDFILLAVGLGDDVWKMLREIKALFPGTQRILMVDTVEQQHALEQPNAEAIMVKGASPDELITIFTRQFSEKA